MAIDENREGARDDAEVRQEEGRPGEIGIALADEQVQKEEEEEEEEGEEEEEEEEEERKKEEEERKKEEEEEERRRKKKKREEEEERRKKERKKEIRKKERKKERKKVSRNEPVSSGRLVPLAHSAIRKFPSILLAGQARGNRSVYPQRRQNLRH
jgi:hypothetical protein